MEKKQYELCLEVLRRLDKARILRSIILIGSWCLPFYRDYFAGGARYLSSIKTRDMDFLVPLPSKIKTKVDVAELLKDLGFILGFRGTKGYIQLEHPELVVEFLVPERGKGLDEPYFLPQLGLNAQPLRFLDFLTQNTINVKLEGISLILPHPANFSLHKLIVSERRRSPAKGIKDREAAIRILKALVAKGERDIIRSTFNSVPQRWQKMIVKALEKEKQKELLRMLRLR